MGGAMLHTLTHTHIDMIGHSPHSTLFITEHIRYHRNLLCMLVSDHIHGDVRVALHLLACIQSA